MLLNDHIIKYKKKIKKPFFKSGVKVDKQHIFILKKIKF
jgi:hypothetical protein